MQNGSKKRLGLWFALHYVLPPKIDEKRLQNQWKAHQKSFQKWMQNLSASWHRFFSMLDDFGPPCWDHYRQIFAKNGGTLTYPFASGMFLQFSVRLVPVCLRFGTFLAPKSSPKSLKWHQNSRKNTKKTQKKGRILPGYGQNLASIWPDSIGNLFKILQ